MNIKILLILSLAISIPSLIFSVNLLMQSSSNLAKIDEEKQRSLPSFKESFGLSLQICDPDKRMSEEELQHCKKDIKFQLDQCDFYGNPDFCNDSRIDKIMNKKPTPDTETSELPEVKNPTQVDMKTYKNSLNGFLIDYPSHWSSREVVYENGIVSFRDMDETKFGLPQFTIKKDNNEFATLVGSVQAYNNYLEQFSVGLGTIITDSENKMTINGVDAYELKFKIKMQISENVQPDYCDGTAFIFDAPNNLIFEYLTCNSASYYDFIPIFERMAQSFTKLS